MLKQRISKKSYRKLPTFLALLLVTPQLSVVAGPNTCGECGRPLGMLSEGGHGVSPAQMPGSANDPAVRKRRLAARDEYIQILESEHGRLKLKVEQLEKDASRSKANDLDATNKMPDKLGKGSLTTMLPKPRQDFVSNDQQLITRDRYIELLEQAINQANLRIQELEKRKNQTGTAENKKANGL